MKLTIEIITIIIIFSVYHFFIHNNLEKQFSQKYIKYDFIKRPLFNCSNNINSLSLKCVGMPSGHAETGAVFSGLLYFYKLIPLWACILFICLISTQRIISHMHTFFQVLVGSILGLIYARIYYKYKYGFAIVFSISLALALMVC